MSRLLSLICCIAIYASILGAQDVFAQGADVGKPLILIANPRMKTPSYRESVILAAPYPVNDGMGHVGVILNRPSTVSMADLFPTHEPSKRVVEPVFFGGPFSSRGMIATLMHSTNAPEPFAALMAAGIYLTFNGKVIDSVIESAPNSARYYVGLVIWLPRELESELKRGLWFTAETKDETIFSKDVEGLWDKLIQSLLQKESTI